MVELLVIGATPRTTRPRQTHVQLVIENEQNERYQLPQLRIGWILEIARELSTEVHLFLDQSNDSSSLIAA